MKPTVYIETSIISHLTARPSNDVRAMASQSVTLEWWEVQRPKIEATCRLLEYEPPIICTPQELKEP